ncbi:glycoside hydrolase family 99-like domain-containing protein [Photobacterium damselae]|uniref:Glycosyl hydrolase n=1 Tax=Photobacterium damselae TaxID=38293 RepID=A0ABD6WYM8_PHODM|nr:glycoside hydrolase family 99-like domain-containing protein [Photobacterium damselae]OBU42448.1 glycosyl hydrolase [Photobacterium damselae]PSU14140.1 glycosyl hydrolase [Photobacterium damselae]
MKNKLKPIAFYLPQFHRVKENDEWWGKGFTEWTNVAKAKPNFSGHYQPHVPREMGFYDLDNVERMREQAHLAKEYGIYGFCFYYYRFDNGRRILERPLDQYVKSDIDFPFCYCWANENWTKTWDGKDNEVLLNQNHGSENDLNFIKDLIPVFKDQRYIKVDGKPVVLVYRADLFKDAKKLTNQWRDLAIQAGFPDLHLCAVQFYGIDDPKEFGFDAAVEFPPHKFIGSENIYTNHLNIVNPEFKGGLVDYKKVLSQSIKRLKPEYKWYRGIIPSWDNTARRQDTGHILVGSSPESYKFWLKYLNDYTLNDINNDENFLFINAWNEWAEGAHLEPDLKYGLSYLEATLDVVNNKKVDLKDYITNSNILDYLCDNLDVYELDSIKRAFTITKYSSDLTGVSNITQNGNQGQDFTNRSFKIVIKNRYPKLVNKLSPLYLFLKKLKSRF